MSRSSYIEDVFSEFYEKCTNNWAMSSHDGRVLNDFYGKIISGEELTQNQAKYLLRLMSTYKNLAKSNGLDIATFLENPVWKRPFRFVDTTRRVSVELNENGLPIVCMKFPYSLKDKFDREVEKENSRNSFWDHDNKLRKLDLYRYNLIHLDEFVKSNNFEIDESFSSVISEAEEIWNQQETITPYSVIENGSVLLKNANDDSINYFSERKTKNIKQDLFLAKSMGFPARLAHSPEDICETISSKIENNFWIKELIEFFNLYKTLDGITVIILDRNTEDVIGWLEKFVNNADYAGIPRSIIKVCFRESENKNSKLNTWIKDNYVGGTVKDGKILIFQHKPPKWIFKEDHDIKIIATNSFTPAIDPITVSWLFSHHCVCYLGDIVPTMTKDKIIVKL